jgi:hypothetical protein
MRRAMLALLAVSVLSGCVLQVSSDPFTNATSQHRTQVEPDSFSFGSTIVAAFQSGRFFDGGASDIGWATSTDGGGHWSKGFLAGVTVFRGHGLYGRASDASVAYDARHHVWLVTSLAIAGPSNAPSAVLASRSTDGGLDWSASPVVVATGAGLDKDWIACDNHKDSPFYGHCYSEYDDTFAGNALHVARSSDGGVTWTQASVPASAQGLGGQPVAQPTGKVVVPYWSATGTIAAITSVNGGATYGSPVTIALLTDHLVAGGLRAPPLPSAEIDGAGNVYVAWADCRFRIHCAENDIVLSTSVNGTSWSAARRVPIDPVTSSVDHFLPGLGLDANTSRSRARIGLAYYFYPRAGCTRSTCQLKVGFIDSVNGGASWSNARQLAGPMSLSWLAGTNQGAMVADYISTSFSAGKAFPLFASAKSPSGSTLDEATYTISGGLAPTAGTATSTHDRSAIVTPARPSTQRPLTSN